MNKRNIWIVAIVILVASFSGVVVYKTYSHYKIECKKEARFDHFMNYWYSFYEQYNKDIEIYTRMKKGIILDYIRNGRGRYINEQVPLYGGGSFSMKHHFYIDQLLDGYWISHRAIAPIEGAPRSRMDERWAFWNIYSCGRELKQIDDYDENLALDINYLESTFNKIDSLAHEIHKSFILLERYKTTQIRNTDINTLNNIPNSEYILENY